MRVAFISHADCGRHDTGWGHPEHVGRLRAITRALRNDLGLFETVELTRVGGGQTPFLAFGDQVRIEMFDRDGRSIFGAIDQRIEHQSRP